MCLHCDGLSCLNFVSILSVMTLFSNTQDCCVWSIAYLSGGVTVVQYEDQKFDLDIYIDGKALSFVMLCIWWSSLQSSMVIFRLMNHKRLKRDFNAV